MSLYPCSQKKNGAARVAVWVGPRLFFYDAFVDLKPFPVTPACQMSSVDNHALI